jgi:hypothetical protein
MRALEQVTDRLELDADLNAARVQFGVLGEAAVVVELDLKPIEREHVKASRQIEEDLVKV